MTDRGTARGAGETAVRDQGYAVVQAHAGQCTGGCEHFAHARATLGSFETDDDDIAGMDLTAKNRFGHFFFTVKDAGRALVLHHLRQDGAFFDDTTVLSQIAFQNGQPAIS